MFSFFGLACSGLRSGWIFAGFHHWAVPAHMPRRTSYECHVSVRISSMKIQEHAVRRGRTNTIQTKIQNTAQF